MKRPRGAIVIVGGGPAGSATAIALRKQGAEQVVIVEAGDYRKDRIGESVPPIIRRLFDQLGIRTQFDAAQHQPCQGSTSCWGDDKLGYNDFIFTPHGAGYHLDRRRFDRFMVDCAIAAGTTCYTKTRVIHCSQAAGESAPIRLVLESGGRRWNLQAKYVVDATGSHARIARLFGAKREVFDRLFCISAYFTLRSHATIPQRTLLEATENGWWYAAPLPGQRVVTAFCCDARTLRERWLVEDEPWLYELAATTHLAPMLTEACLLPGSLQGCEVQCGRLDSAIGDHWLAVGDAASSYDPLSSQGIYKAIEQGMFAATAITASELGDSALLGHYAREVEQSFQDHCHQRTYFYQLEQRWPASSFWSGRHLSRSLGQASGVGEVAA